MESLRIFHDFKLDALDKVWVQSIWDSEFLTYTEPTDDYLEYLESKDTRRLLHECCLVLKEWIVANRSECEISEYSWQALMILNINIRSLLVMLGYIMKTGQCAEFDEDSRQACLEATSLYLMLLTVPGSNAFGIYHPNLYARAIKTLKMSESLVSADRKSGKETNVISSNIDDESTDSYIMLDSEKLKLVKELNKIICDLVVMSQSFRFKEHTESLDITIRTLLDITRLEMYIKLHNNYRLTSLSQNAFVALQELCSSNHGTVAMTIMLIAQYILPDMLFHHTNVQAKSVIMHESAVMHFLGNLLKVYKIETMQAVITLIHQLMVRCPERSEGRQKQAAVVIKLLNICNIDTIITVLRDIILFSHNGKVSYRLFAQEIIGKLLTEFFLSNDLNNDMKLKMRKILVAVVLSRSMDQSVLVRGKAMATFALVSDCNNDIDKMILEKIFEVSASNKPFSMLDELERALSQDVDPLPGSTTVVAMLLDRVNDERALVQRSALKILRNLSIMFPALTDKMTHVISNRCKDPTLTVRQFAVHVLSEILEHFPHNLSLLNEWTQAVVPQIYDIEVKVQEKVLECLGNVLLNRITKASTYIPNAANNLPWRVLEKLSKMKMRKHLSKACGLWVKNGVINKSMISNLQSHIGTDNNIGAWILLAALAENMKIPSIDKYIVDYKEIIQKNDYHASLVLHVLRHTWSVLNHDYLEDLQQHLYKRICHFEITFNLISICLDILSVVLRHLHAEESSKLIEMNMLELMRLSEAEIQDLTLEESRSLVQETLKVRAICTLGHASLLCTSKISSSTLRALERLLLQWESLSEATKEIKNLQASAVVILCQQALRDREIAKEVTPIFGNLMRQETNPDLPIKTAVKINAAKALADICVRFTDLVEPYLPDMCISMKDSNSDVREAIIVIFTQLLLEDFIKLKGPFFFHILTMLSDADGMIRELTIFLVEEKLLAKNKTLIFKQFLESIYHYNNYRSRSAFCGHRMSDRERELLTLPGKMNQNKRNIIYEFMLDHLDVSAKFNLVIKLTKNILGEICDHNSIDITTEEGACVLKDTVFIIGNNRLQLSSLNEKQKDDTQEQEETSHAPKNNAINVVIAAMKKHNLDHLLPMLVTLKKKLVALKSHLKDDVESLLFKIYSEYDEEQLLGVLNEYPELEKEMNRYQRKLKDKTVSENSDSRNDNSSLIMNHRSDSELSNLCRQSTPKVLLRRLSPSTIMRYKNKSMDSGICLQQFATSDSDASVTNPSIHLERLLSIQTPPPEPNHIPSISTRNSYPSDSCTPRLRRLSSEREISPEYIPRRKLFKK